MLFPYVRSIGMISSEVAHLWQWWISRTLLTLHFQPSVIIDCRKLFSYMIFSQSHRTCSCTLVGSNFSAFSQSETKMQLTCHSIRNSFVGNCHIYTVVLVVLRIWCYKDICSSSRQELNINKRFADSLQWPLLAKHSPTHTSHICIQ